MSNYVALLLAVVAFITTFSWYKEDTVADNYIPFATPAFAVINLFLPLYGVSLSWGRRRKLILATVVVQGLTVVAYRAGYLLYLYAEESEAEGAVFDAEVVVGVLQLSLAGLPGIGFGVTLYSKLRRMGKKRRNVVTVGLDNSGKTALLSHVVPAPAESVHTMSINPTAGLALYSFAKWDVLWRVWDMSGQGRNRELWTHYYAGAHCIVFVVDLSDLERMGNVKDELRALLDNADVRERRPLLLFFGNKVDLEEREDGEIRRLTAMQLRNVLQLDALSGKFRFKVLASSGIDGACVEDGFRWIAESTESFFEA